ncbi:hypothetical protein LEMLEM_LOCUS20998 [Lemmus lemmus]
MQMCVCVCVCVHTCLSVCVPWVCRCTGRPEAGAGGADGCEPCDMVLGTESRSFGGRANTCN